MSNGPSPPVRYLQPSPDGQREGQLLSVGASVVGMRAVDWSGGISQEDPSGGGLEEEALCACWSPVLYRAYSHRDALSFVPYLLPHE